MTGCAPLRLGTTKVLSTVEAYISNKVSWEKGCGNLVSVSATWVGPVPPGMRGAYHGKRRAYRF